MITRTPRGWLHGEEQLTEAVTFSREAQPTHNKLSGATNTPTLLFPQTLISCRHFPFAEYHLEPKGKGSFMGPNAVSAFQVGKKGAQSILKGQMKGR